LIGATQIPGALHPFHPKQVCEKKIGSQLNMVSQSWDGKRVYFTSSLFANWDKKGEEDEQYLKAYTWDGTKLDHEFTVDFYEEALGRPHIMRFGAFALYGLSGAERVAS
jgi:selenium-binding protein 1